MSSIHYKFRATLEYKTLAFEGLAISATDCKREICTKENIKAESFDLVLQNAHTKRNYTNEDLIARNSSIIVQRVPRENAEKLPKIQGGNSGLVQRTQASSSPLTAESAHYDTAAFENLTEEQRLALVKDASTRGYQPDKYVKRTNQIMSGRPPPTYTCNRCYQPGHWYKNCPMLNTKRTTGIPGDELMETTPDDPQAMRTPTGKYVVPIMHWKARNSKRPDTGEIPLSEREVPEELKCPICALLLKDAILTACCGTSFCAECVSVKLTETESRVCPNCHREGLGVDQLVPNKSVRAAVEKWINQGQTSVAGLAEQSQPAAPERRNKPSYSMPTAQQPRQRLRIGIQQTAEASPAQDTGGGTPGQEDHQTQQLLWIGHEAGGEGMIIGHNDPAPPGVTPGEDASAVAAAVAAGSTESVSSALSTVPSTVPLATEPQQQVVGPGGGMNLVVPVAVFQPNVPPPPIAPTTVVMIDPVTQQPIYNQPQFGMAGTAILPGGAVYQASQMQLQEAWQEYLNRDKGVERKKRSKTPKRKRRRKRSRSSGSSSDSSSSSSSSSSSDSSREYRRRTRDDRRYRHSGGDRYYRNDYPRVPYRGGRGMSRGPMMYRGGNRGRAGFHTAWPPGAPAPGGQVPMVDGTMGMPMRQDYYAHPKSLLEGDIEPPPGTVVPPELLSAKQEGEGGEDEVKKEGEEKEEGKEEEQKDVKPPREGGGEHRERERAYYDPRDSRPPVPRGHFYGGYRGRGRGGYERDERRMPYREDERYRGSGYRGHGYGGERRMDRRYEEEDYYRRERPPRGSKYDEYERDPHYHSHHRRDEGDRREHRKKEEYRERERGDERKKERRSGEERRESEEKRREEEIEATIKDVELHMGDDHSEDEEERRERRKRREERKKKKREKKEKEEREEKEGQTDNKPSIEEASEVDTTEDKQPSWMQPSTEEKEAESSQGDDNDKGREKKHKKHKKHKKEKKAKRDRKRSDDDEESADIRTERNRSSENGEREGKMEERRESMDDKERPEKTEMEERRGGTAEKETIEKTEQEERRESVANQERAEKEEKEREERRCALEKERMEKEEKEREERRRSAVEMERIEKEERRKKMERREAMEIKERAEKMKKEGIRVVEKERQEKEERRREEKERRMEKEGRREKPEERRRESRTSKERIEKEERKRREEEEEEERRERHKHRKSKKERKDKKKREHGDSDSDEEDRKKRRKTDGKEESTEEPREGSETKEKERRSIRTEEGLRRETRTSKTERPKSGNMGIAQVFDRAPATVPQMKITLHLPPS